MRILLTLAPAWLPTHPYLGTALISGVLKDHGFEVKNYDFNLEACKKASKDDEWLWHSEKSIYWIEEKQYREYVVPVMKPLYGLLLSEIKNYNPDYLGFTVLCTNSFITMKAISLVRQMFPKIKIICGGPAITQKGAISLVTNGVIDAGFFGDAEESIVEYLNNDDDTKEIKGVVYKGANGLKIGSKYYSNLNTDTIPNFDDLNLDDYKSNHRVLPMFFSKGCIARCNFCGESRDIDKYRARTAEKVVREMKTQQEKYDVHQFSNVDTLVNGNPKLLENICKLIIENGVDAIWGGQCRFDRGLTEERIELMYKAGCRYLIFGFESASQHVLNLMDKDVKMEEVYRIIPLLHKYGIRVMISIIVGYPGEEEEHFQETLDFLDEYHPFIYDVSFSQALMIVPGTVLAQNYHKFDIEVDSAIGWYTKDRRNTPEVRRERHQRLLAKLQEINLKAPVIQWKNWGL